jgi:hypothetical protein
VHVTQRKSGGSEASRAYPRLRRIDGRHPLKQAAPGTFVDYRARRRRDSEVAYFNFALAREMGLIPTSHPDRLTRELRRAIVETFGLVIINEYDYLNATPIPRRDLLPNGYMATRYLQLQHPDKRGANSGDGRSVWNGSVTHRGSSWDVSSCGTGVTRLCPATSHHQTFYKTGNWISDYGCGTAALAEGINAAVMSEVFHRNDIATERVLAVLSLPGGLAINVRAAPCLLRPSHFFVHLHQDNRESLRSIVDLFIDRRVANGDWPELPEANTTARARRRYGHFAQDAARTFARITAQFESEYVFCWLDWDGDNILADGGIIDYGSVRQFGLYHREYRFEDTDRMSTTIPEQRKKARHIAQKYAQIRDYLITGTKAPLRSFANDPILALFDAEFERVKRERLLRRIGFDDRGVGAALAAEGDALERFERVYASFERARSSRGPTKVPDGLTWNAVFCARDLLRELPLLYLGQLAEGRSADRLDIPAKQFLEIALSAYASRRDRALTPYRARRARDFQRAWRELVASVAAAAGHSLERQLSELAERSAVINHAARITGDSVDYASAQLIRRRRDLSPEALYRLIQRFTDYQDLDPDRVSARKARSRSAPVDSVDPVEDRVHARLVDITHELRESL